MPETRQVVVVNPAGEVVAIPADYAADAAAQGYRPASPEQIADFDARRAAREHFGGPAGQALAFGQKLASTLTFGGTDVAARAFGADPAVMRGAEEANPGTTLAASVLGIAAPLIATGGGSAVAQGGLRGAAAFSAPALAARGGAAVTDVVGAALARTALPKMVQRGVASGAGSMVEGTAIGAGEFVHERMLGDARPIGEHLAATVGPFAAIGGGLGAAIGVAGGSLGKLVETARTALAKTEGAARGGLVERLYPKVASKLTGVEEGTISELVQKRSLIIRDPEERIRLAKEVGDSLQEQHDAIESALRAANRRARPAEIRELTATADAAAVEREYVRLTKATGDTARKMRDAPDLFPPMYPAKLEELRNGLIRDFNAGARTPGAVFERLDDMKGTLDPISRWSKLLAPEHREAIGLVRGLRAEVKASLENEALWGPAAARQAAFNATQAEYFEALKAFRKKFMEQSSTPTGGVYFKLNPVKLNTALNQAADPRGMAKAEVLDRFVEASRGMVDEIEKSYRTTAAEQFARKSLDDLIAKAKGRTLDARERARLTQLLNQLDPRMSWGSMPVGIPGARSAVGALGEALLGGAVFGPVGAAAGAAHAGFELLRDVPRVVGALSAADRAGETLRRAFRATQTNPETVATLAAIERSAQETGARIRESAIALVRGSGVKRAAKTEAVVALAKAFGEKPSDAATAYLKAAERLRALSQNPEAMADAIDKAIEDVHEHAPDIALSAASTTGRAVAFLASKLPEPPETGPLGPRLTPSPAALARFGRYVDAVNDPMGVLRHASAGTLTLEHVEGLTVVYPDLYDRMRTTLLEQIADQQNEVPFRSRLMLSMLLGEDLDGSFTVGARNVPPPQPPAASMPRPAAAEKITLADRTKTPMQRSAERE